MRARGRDEFLGRGKLGRDIMALCIMSKCGGKVWVGGDGLKKRRVKLAVK